MINKITDYDSIGYLNWILDSGSTIIPYLHNIESVDDLDSAEKIGGKNF